MKIGYDNNADGDILDAGDDMQVSDNFDSGTISLTCDNNGNLTLDTALATLWPRSPCDRRASLATLSQGLTGDGNLKYVYDGWNRLVKVNRYADGDTTTIGTYAYLPDNRRASKLVTNCGIEQTAGDGGNTTVHFYYAGRTGVSPVNWSIVETRNGSNQATRQWVWGTQYVDELLFMDVNGDASESNDCDPDAQGGESTYDRRYFYHQDRNWNVVALTEYDDGVGTDGRICERYAYTPYGEFIVLKGDAGDGELGRALGTSGIGNPFAHQGLPFDHEKTSYQNRHRECFTHLQRFGQRDPLGMISHAIGRPGLEVAHLVRQHYLRELVSALSQAPANSKFNVRAFLRAGATMGLGCSDPVAFFYDDAVVYSGERNLYAFARSSPLAKVDPTGLYSCDNQDAMFCVFVITFYWCNPMYSGHGSCLCPLGAYDIWVDPGFNVFGCVKCSRMLGPDGCPCRTDPFWYGLSGAPGHR